jgi:hypothetical protein
MSALCWRGVTIMTITGAILSAIGLTLLFGIVPFMAASLVGVPNATSPSKGDDLAKIFTTILPGLVGIGGAVKLSKATGGKGARRGHRATGRAATSDSATEESAFRLSPSFDSGLFGGLIGGALAGLLIGVLYYGKSVRGDAAGFELVLLIFAYSCFAGCVFGACTQLGILWARYAAAHKGYPGMLFNEVLGGVLGGGAAGILLGSVGGWLFGVRPEEFVDTILLTIGSVAGALCVAFGALFYDYRGRWRDVVRVLLTSLCISAFVAVIGGAILQALQIERLFETNNPLLLARSGAVLGAVLGLVLGLQVGLTLFLYRSWASAAAPVEPQAGKTS